VSIFEHGIFTNSITNYGVVIALLLGCFLTYTPGLQTIVGSGNPYSLIILEAALFTSFGLWGWAEGRKWVTRNYPADYWVNRWFAW
jgi:hypothetical protein